MKQVLLALLMAGTLSSVAMADVELLLTDNGDTTCNTGDCVLVNSSGTVIKQHGVVTTVTSAGADGVITWDGRVGNYNINVTTGQGSPTEPPATLDLNSVDDATNVKKAGVVQSGPLDIFFSENNVSPAAPGWTMMFGGTLQSGKGATVAYSAFESNSNAFFAMTNLIGTVGPFPPGAFSGETTGVVPGVVAPYSLTQEIAIKGVGSTVYSGDASLTPLVPEPTAVVLLGSVLLGTVSLLRRKARRS
jgi:hypothetical protein